jgi:hypothetical protein
MNKYQFKILDEYRHWASTHTPTWETDNLIGNLVGWTNDYKGLSTPPQTDKTTWETKFNKYYGLMFECGDYEQLIKDIANELRKEYARGQLDEITAIRQLDTQALDVYRGKLIEEIEKRKKDELKTFGKHKELSQGYIEAMRQVLTLIKEEKI